MSLEVYYPSDIRNALLAAKQATASALLASGEVDDRFLQGYRDGYVAALATIALAFGLVNETQMVRENKHNLSWRDCTTLAATDTSA